LFGDLTPGGARAADAVTSDTCRIPVRGRVMK